MAAARAIPGGHFWVPGPADWWLWGFYGGLGLLAAFPRLRPPRRWCVGLLAGWIIVGFAAAHRHDQPTAGLHVPERRPRHRRADRASLRPDDALRRRPDRLAADPRSVRSPSRSGRRAARIRRRGALPSRPGPLQRLARPAGAVFGRRGLRLAGHVRQGEPGDDGVAAGDRRSTASPIREIQAGDRLRGGDGCLLEVLHPSDEVVLGVRSENANSIVLAVRIAATRFF